MNRILRIALVSIVVARTTGMVAAVVAFASVAYGQVAPVDVIHLTVDVAGAKAEISPLVYGQFIEHLGRCIRDGIWAEKLRDRKFLLEMGKSPWQPLKPSGAEADVFLDPAGAYGGAHALAVWVRDSGGGACGVSQAGIGLLKDKDRTARTSRPTASPSRRRSSV
jgi:hypothetical protein